MDGTDGRQDMRSSAIGALKEICKETHQISDQGHRFPLPEVWHAVDAVKSTTHPADKQEKKRRKKTPSCNLRRGTQTKKDQSRR